MAPSTFYTAKTESSSNTPERHNDEFNAHGTPMSTSHINGEGLWASWTRNFISPELALLDLFDNAIDATLHPQFNGRIEVYRDPPLNSRGRADGICLKNNCFRAIPELSTVLTVFGSEKRCDQIGENGVGVKQACAALSDLSIIITMNEGNRFSIGFLFKEFQTSDGCLIPSFTLKSDNVVEEITQIARENVQFNMSMKHYGGGDFHSGLERLLAHLEDMSNQEEERAFLVVLHRIIHRGHGGGVKAIIESLVTLLPKTYLHIPDGFEVIIDSKTLCFKYWEQRLSEIHKFTLKIDPNHSFTMAQDWHYPNHGHFVCLYLGFDPFRACIENDNKASLLIYSRKSGRLVKEIEDARGQLGLSSGGTDFAQGLTVILDDLHGNLPLTPTKQDIAFGQEACGKIHEKNLMSWIGAFSHLYYQHFLEVYGSKADLRAEVLSHQGDLKKLRDPVSLESGNFSSFEELTFKVSRQEKIRCMNRKKAKWVSRSDSAVKFRKPAPALPVKNTIVKAPVAKKRKAMKSVIQTPTRSSLVHDTMMEAPRETSNCEIRIKEEASVESNDFKLKLREMQLQSVQKKFLDSNKKLKEQSKDNESLRSQLEEAQNAREGSYSSTNEVDLLKAELVTSRDSMQALRGQLTQTQEELRLTQDKVGYEKKQWFEQSQRTVHEINSIRGKNESLNFRLQNLEVEKENLNTQLELQKSQLTDTPDQSLMTRKLQEEKQNAYETIHNLRQMLDARVGQSGPDELRMELVDLQSKCNEQQRGLEKSQSDNTKLREYSRNLQQTYESLKSISGM